MSDGGRRPILFTRFLTWLTAPERPEGVVPERGQWVLVRVCFDGVDPIDLPPGERAIARQLFGPVDRFPPLARKIIAEVIGGRAGKSYFNTLRLLHLCCTVSLEGFLAPGQRAHAAILAPDVETAKEALVYFVGACATSPRLRGSVDADLCRRVLERGEAVEKFIFRRPVDGKFVEVAVRAVRAGGSNVRGRWYVGALMDEACLFYTDGYRLSDEGPFKAICPRILPGGQMLLSSTPWLDSGVLYRLWHSEFGRPSTAIVAHAPTLVLRPDNLQVREVVQAAYEADARTGEETAAREFGAQFGTGAADDFLPKDMLKIARVDESLAPPRPGESVGMGGDLAFDRNSSSLVGAVDDGKKIRLALVVERKPRGGVSLRPSKVCAEFAQLVRLFGADGLTADRHYQATLREHLEGDDDDQAEGDDSDDDEETGLRLDAPPSPEEAWVLFKTLLAEGRLSLPRGTPEEQLLFTQLEGTKFRRLPKKRVAIVLPEGRDGRHGDLAASAVLAVWAVVRRPKVIPVPVEQGSEAWERQQRDRRLAAWREQRRQEREPAGGWGDGAAMPGGWYE